ncbi:MAG: hypothetical protein ISQ14_05235 [Verrucomicrobiae bacterium]|nr:hypothetical protein [Verrucomicrobiae bacterium]
MQNLENEIQQWRERYRVNGQLSEAEIEELESHLRDAVEDLSGRGLSEEEAFLVARRRFGSDESVATEFEKMDPMRVWIQRTKWMLVGTLALQVLLVIRTFFVSHLFGAFARGGTPAVPDLAMAFLEPFIFTGIVIFVVYRCWGRIVTILERFSGWCGRCPKAVVLAAVMFGCFAPIVFLMVSLSLSVGIQRLFDGSDAVRFDWRNLISSMVWPLSLYGPIGLVILALHRWENRRETISDL